MIEVTTSIIYRPDKTILMQLRDGGNGRSIPYPNQWQIPGGHREESDKNMIDTNAREILEEFEIKLNPDKCKLLTIWIDAKGQKNYVYTCSVNQDQKVVLKEGADFAWLPLEKIKKLELAYLQETILDKIEDFLKTF